MEELKEITVLDGAGVSKAKVKTASISDLEASIIARSEDLNIPALASFHEVTEDVVKAALAKK
jgi:3-deoxy-D-manno-octulosonate 8-phosphate phosphatase KdsC-like HAD superfamily phosphatase